MDVKMGILSGLLLVFLWQIGMHFWGRASGQEVLEWGTLRPNIYFGVRAKVPDSPLVGVLWYNPDSGNWPQAMRHDCEERDGLSRYGWLQHDGFGYGVQELCDKPLNLNLTTSFIKRYSGESEEWVSRIEGVALKQTSPTNVSFLWYVTVPTQGLKLRKSPSKGLSEDVEIDLDLGSYGQFELKVGKVESNSHPNVDVYKVGQPTPTTQDLDQTSFVGFKNLQDPWKVKDKVIEVLVADYRRIWTEYAQAYSHGKKPKKNKRQDQPPMIRIVPQLSNIVEQGANVLVFQHIFTLPFTLDIVFKSKAQATSQLLDHSFVTGILEVAGKNFSNQFDSTFSISPDSVPAPDIFMAKAVLSNLVGGIGYFHGDWLAQLSDKAEVTRMPATTLFTAVPSRSFFPRGFLWDEGFHQLIVSRWNPHLSLKIMRAWFNQIDKNGWLPREQILGSEPRGRVPAEFQVQRPSVANPPTLILALHRLLELVESPITVPLDPIRENIIETDSNPKKFSHTEIGEEEFQDFLLTVFPALQRHVNWFFKTQASGDAEGSIEKTTSFRWRGRTLDHALSSGLDDYPRADFLTSEEGHVDLHSWMILMCDTMYKITHHLSEKNITGSQKTELTRLATLYQTKADGLRESLVLQHWNEEKNMYCDYGYLNGTRRSVCHTGYISLFPFLLKIISPTSPHLQATLEMLKDPKGIWSKYGLLSLSREDPGFGTKEDYWRGNIWININYLAVSALHHYGYVVPAHSQTDLCQELYRKLRKNLIKNIQSNYRKTGYLWEQYSAKDGKGRKSHPFTGWTSLVLLLLAEVY